MLPPKRQRGFGRFAFRHGVKFRRSRLRFGIRRRILRYSVLLLRKRRSRKRFSNVEKERAWLLYQKNRNEFVPLIRQQEKQKTLRGKSEHIELSFPPCIRLRKRAWHGRVFPEQSKRHTFWHPRRLKRTYKKQ